MLQRVFLKYFKEQKPNITFCKVWERRLIGKLTPNFGRVGFWIEPTLHQLGSRALSISTGSNLYYVTKTMKVKQKIIYIHTYIHTYIYIYILEIKKKHRLKFIILENAVKKKIRSITINQGSMTYYQMIYCVFKSYYICV